MNKEIEIPEGYKARIDGNKVIIELKESEEERIRKSIILLIQRGGYMSPEDKTKAFAWLEKQKKQKDVSASTMAPGCWQGEEKSEEWSEEDEKTIRDAINRIKQLDHYWNRATDENLIKRLKSLRPQLHWKPSKKQMETLKNCAYGAYQNGDGPALRELYNGLEKLYYE